ncbi:MAG TPA: hypothetical protein VMZ50_10555 [Phycisphaerae bacterium]|nr:hypothetical protein [Phycisphaerae bacterium]
MGKKGRRGVQVKAAPVPPKAKLPGTDPILTAPMRRSEYEVLAREIARREIMAVAGALGKQVYDMVSKGVDLAPVVERIDVCLAEQNRFNVVLNAMVEVLIDKGAFTREELTAKAEEIADEAIKKNQERHRTLVAKARQERGAAARAEAADTVPTEPVEARDAESEPPVEQGP